MGQSTYGTLKAVGSGMRNAECGTRNGDQDAVASCVHETAGAPAGLKVMSEEATIRADGTGIAHVVVTVVDDQGRFVPGACPEITVEVDGPARLVGLENGDPLDTTNYKLKHRRAFHGMMLAVVQADCPVC